ncbi:MAG: hypothetical protein ABG776_20275 [Cyanobacteria bacterium J06555_13]
MHGQCGESLLKGTATLADNYKFKAMGDQNKRFNKTALPISQEVVQTVVNNWLLQELPDRFTENDIKAAFQAMQSPKQSPYQIFEEFGVIGCMDGEDELPSTDEPSIREHLQSKRQQSRL